jgi:DNA-binding transcriptional MerR regulator
MDVRLTIGEFSKMTYLSVKALRHYHDVGLLTPDMVDPATGYRRYASSQVTTAQAIRRFRDLDMPIDDVRRVLHAPDIASRNDIILAHLQRMQQQLERTQLSITSLQALLEDEPRAPAEVEYRSVPAMPVLVRRRFVAFDDCAEWLERALGELHAHADGTGLTIGGPDGALYPDEFFEAAAGEVTAFVPVIGRDAAVVELPPTVVAVLVHRGAFSDVDQTYGALGTVVAERGIGAPGPIREHYLVSGDTEVCWPITTESVV